MKSDPPPQKISRYAKPEFFQTVSLATIATEIGRTPKQTIKLLNKLSFIGLRYKGCAPGIAMYDARAIEAVKALLKQPHRKTGTSADDWLSDYVNNEGKQ